MNLPDEPPIGSIPGCAGLSRTYCPSPLLVASVEDVLIHRSAAGPGSVSSVIVDSARRSSAVPSLSRPPRATHRVQPLDPTVARECGLVDPPRQILQAESPARLRVHDADCVGLGQSHPREAPCSPGRPSALDGLLHLSGGRSLDPAVARACNQLHQRLAGFPGFSLLRPLVRDFSEYRCRRELLQPQKVPRGVGGFLGEATSALALDPRSACLGAL